MKSTALTAAAVLAVSGLTTLPASAGTTAGCHIHAGSVTTAGDHFSTYLESGKPITRHDISDGRGAVKDLPVRFYGDWYLNPDAGWNTNGFGGYVVAGDYLYHRAYWVVRPGDTATDTRTTRIGGGWTGFRALVSSFPVGNETSQSLREYALRSDGTLLRWHVGYRDDKPRWFPSGEYKGFGAVKTMALISRTSTYDTLLVTLRGGALYTVRIPLNAASPVVKKIRSSTWQGFESIMAARCGRNSSLLLAIDKDTGKGYLYAMSHANGLSTVIQSLGQAPGQFTNKQYFRLVNTGVDEQLFGE